jgi:hypothetical protein
LRQGAITDPVDLCLELGVPVVFLVLPVRNRHLQHLACKRSREANPQAVCACPGRLCWQPQRRNLPWLRSALASDGSYPPACAALP